MAICNARAVKHAVCTFTGQTHSTKEKPKFDSRTNQNTDTLVRIKLCCL